MNTIQTRKSIFETMIAENLCGLQMGCQFFCDLIMELCYRHICDFVLSPGRSKWSPKFLKNSTNLELLLFEVLAHSNGFVFFKNTWPLFSGILFYK